MRRYGALALALLFAFVGRTYAATWEVGSGKTYSTMTAAVAALSASVGSSTFTEEQTILVYDGTYEEEVQINSVDDLHPTSDYHLIIKAATGNSPVVDCGGDKMAFAISETDYVDVDGFELKNAYWYGAGLGYGAVAESGLSCNHVSIKNCTIHDVTQRFGVIIVGQEGGLTDATVEGCTFYNITNANYNASAVCVWDNVDGVLIKDNIVHDTRYGMYAGVQNQPGVPPINITISGNIIYDTVIAAVYTENESMTGIVVDGNVCHSATGAGITVGTNQEVYNNVVWGYAGSGIMMPYPGFKSGTKIYNNTVFGCGTGGGYSAGIYTYYATAPDVKNNIVFGNYYQIWFRAGSGWISNYNCIWQGDGTHFCRTAGDYDTMAAWRTAGFDAQGVNADPLVASEVTPDFRLLTGSPALNVGADLSGTLTDDILGVTRPVGAAFDMGAYEGIYTPPVEAGGARASKLAGQMDGAMAGRMNDWQ